jgi:hypothetical protein
MTTAHILWPRPSLAGCVFATIVRDTRGVAHAHDERFNHFPAGPFCGVTTLFAGRTHLLSAPAHVSNPSIAPLLPVLAVSGPQRGPTLSWSAGPIYAATVIFYPDALVALSGFDAGSHVDRIVAAEGALLPAVLDPFHAFQSAAEYEPIHRSFRTFEDGLECIWQRTRPPGHAVSAWLQDWGRSVVARASLSGAGRSARQIERRIKSLTGLTERDLHAFGRSEHLFASIGTAAQSGKLNWAQLASEVGFADQSHMTRRVRRETGLPPDQLVRAVANHEAFWCYRLLGERY